MLDRIEVRNVTNKGLLKCFACNDLQKALDWVLKNEKIDNCEFWQNDDIEDGSLMFISADDVYQLREAKEYPNDLTFF